MHGGNKNYVTIPLVRYKESRVVVETGENRVLRGGSWANNGRNVRSAYRNVNEPSNRNDNIGFRLARARQQNRMICFGPEHYPVRCGVRKQQWQKAKDRRYVSRGAEQTESLPDDRLKD